MTHRIIRRAALAASGLLAALSIGLTSSTAQAHGGIPRAFGILFEPGKPDDIMLRSDVWGIFRSKDGGKSWFYGCAELYKSNSLNADHRNMLLAPGGRMLVAGGFSGLLISDDLCSWHSSKTFSKDLPDGGTFSELVQDVLLRDDYYLAVTATGVNGVIDGSLWKSTDKGETWAKFGKPLPSDFAGTSVGIPPSGSTTRIYVSGRHIDADGVIQVSDDNGMTWKAYTVPTQMEYASIRIAAMHSTDPNTFFVWVDQPEGLGMDSPDEIYGSQDGGKTYKLLYTSTGDLPGLALSPDNSEILVAGPLDSIVAAKVADAFAMGKAAFTPRLTGCPNNAPCQVWGLAWTSAGLYAGMNDFVTGGLTKATFGVSMDSGKTFTKIMDLCDVKFETSCAPDSTMAQACKMVWDTGYAFDYTNGPRCMPTCTVDPTTNTCSTNGGASGAAGAAGASAGTGAATSGSGAATTGTGATTTGTGAGTNSGMGGTPSGGAAGAGTGGGKSGGDGGCNYATAPRPAGLGLIAFALGVLGLSIRRRTRVS